MKFSKQCAGHQTRPTGDEARVIYLGNRLVNLLPVTYMSDISTLLSTSDQHAAVGGSASVGEMQLLAGPWAPASDVPCVPAVDCWRSLQGAPPLQRRS